MKAEINIAEEDNSNLLLKRLIWLYFWLIIFEGALRKWVFPGLATPLLIVRDPIAIWIFFIARNKGLLPLNKFLISMSIVGILGMFTSLVSGHGNILVSLYGARSYLIHFPLVFIIGNVFSRYDVLKMGKFILWISIPMVILIGFQFYSPQSAWVNLGIGGDTKGGGFDGALGYFRPPGTFSFTTGTASFFCLVGVFVSYFWLNGLQVNLLLLLASTVALLASIPLSISRTLFFQISITVAFAVFGGVRKPKHILRIVIASFGIVIIGMSVSNTDVFITATDVLSTRFENASVSEGGVVKGALVNRFFGGFIKALAGIEDLPFFGYGLGIGTNAASMLLRGYLDFTVGEDEWSRIIGELGPFLGLTVIFIRISFMFTLLNGSFKRLAKSDFLPWLLMSVTILLIAQGNWAQPTSLGFSTLITGLTLAALNNNTEEA